ncbi:MAG: hypothetical protein ACRD27_06085, partial [Terracidiphilus sp.]
VLTLVDPVSDIDINVADVAGDLGVELDLLVGKQFAGNIELVGERFARGQDNGRNGKIGLSGRGLRGHLRATAAGASCR